MDTQCLMHIIYNNTFLMILTSLKVQNYLKIQILLKELRVLSTIRSVPTPLDCLTDSTPRIYKWTNLTQKTEKWPRSAFTDWSGR